MTFLCPGFVWDRVNFFSGSWCTVAFWIWDENNVDNIVMFSVAARQSRTLQLLMLPGAQEVGRGHGWDSWPQLTQGIFHAVWCHARHVKLEEEERRGGRLEWRHLPSQVTVTCNGALLPWSWLNTCLPMGSREWIPSFALPAHMAFALPIKLSLCQPTSFLTITPLISSPILPGGVSERLWGADLLTGVKPWHSISKLFCSKL